MSALASAASADDAEDPAEREEPDEPEEGPAERPVPAAVTFLVTLCVATFFALAQWRLGYSQLTTLTVLRVRVGAEWLLVRQREAGAG
jgi:hypothetical protein